MIRMLVFDLDGTLALRGEGILPEDMKLLKKLEEEGYQLAVCSGKPTYYLCGFLRQAGLTHTWMVGENGATIQYGVELPPRQYYEYPYRKEAKDQIRQIRELIDGACRDMVWYQPNEAELTPFIINPEAFSIIGKLVEDHPDLVTELDVYPQVDCFDFVPKEISKQNGLRFLSEITGIGPQEMVAFGDGINDLPMFEYAGMTVGIGDNQELPTDYHYDTIGEALQNRTDYLKEAEERK